MFIGVFSGSAPFATVPYRFDSVKISSALK